MTSCENEATTFLDRINMIKKIKRIWDGLWSWGNTRSFALLFFLAFCVSANAGDHPVSKETAVQTAIEATQKLREMDHETLDGFRIVATECSGEINTFTKNNPDSPYIESLRAKLKDKSYWTIAFSRKELRPGGLAVVFVDQKNGESISESETSKSQSKNPLNLLNPVNPV